MSQQIPTTNGQPYQSNDNHVRRLFLQTGFGYEEIASSKGMYTDELGVDHAVARIVEDYMPPTPTVKSAELKISNAPSRLHAGGKESYKIGLRLIFPDKLSYNDFLFLCGNEFKFYDEKGAIFQCVMVGSPESRRIEAGSRYDVRIQLVGVKKETEEEEEVIKYTDLTSDTVKELYVSSSANSTGYIDINFSAIGKSISARIYYWYDVNRIVTAIYNELIDEDIDYYYTISIVEGNKIRLAAKRAEYAGSISVTGNSTGSSVTSSSVEGAHWASEFIRNCARLGLVTQYDRNGNYVYTFSPNEYATRAQLASVLNRLRRYVERVLRG